jgi:protein-S-isoprenylcysteine O-methyltransferase Ste14
VTAWALVVLQGAGAVIGVAAIRRINVAELAGMAEPQARDDLQFGGAYGLVRHPLYLAVVLILFGTRQMTADRLLFSILTMVYVIVAIPFEEAGLRQQFGPRYLEYRRQVRWRLIPYIH